jgi:curved DNA-binding protein CbpA
LKYPNFPWICGWIWKSFAVLGSAPSSPLTKKKLKKHYRLLAMRFHPDREGGCPETFKSLQQAYDSLNKVLTAK